MATDATAQHGQPGEGQSSVLAAVANEMVRLYKEQFGRGPMKARANWCGDDLLCVTLEETLTPAERNLAALGQHERLRETRMFFQYATVREFCEPVERITDRKVRSFVSGMDAEVGGLSIESFVFYPVGHEDDGPSRMELVPPPVR
ncbi:MAG: Na-translocating system protein MpsC family protein [Conexibacter sp.]